MKCLYLTAAVFCILTAEVCADRVYTRNGTWEGSVFRETPTQIDLETADGSIITIPRANITRIECTAEEEAAELLAEIAAIKGKAEDAYGSGNLLDALHFYRKIAEIAGLVREKAGRLYEEALEIKSRAESRAESLRESVRSKGIFMADEAGPKDILREKGIAFEAAAFVEAAGRGDDEAVALFLEAGLAADATTAAGTTALMKACMQGRATTAGKLIAAGAAVNLQDEAGFTALHYAMRSGDKALIQLIVDSTH